jgi:hypothetical protein
LLPLLGEHAIATTIGNAWRHLTRPRILQISQLPRARPGLALFDRSY